MSIRSKENACHQKHYKKLKSPILIEHFKALAKSENEFVLTLTPCAFKKLSINMMEYDEDLKNREDLSLLEDVLDHENDNIRC